MPSTYAHYRLGQQVRRELEGNERKIIEKYPQLYLIGLHGLDILFYYKPLRPNPVNQIGYAWGYAGSCIPFIVSLVFVLGYQKMGFSFETGMMIAFAVVAVWWLVMSLPLMKQYRQVHYVERKSHAMRESVGRIIETLRSVRKQKKIFLFLIAFFFFIDGVYTIIDMATAYGSALGLDSKGLLLALLVTQFVAFPFSILFGRLAEKYDTGKLILTCIAAYMGITVFAVFMKAQWQFWVLAIFVGMFQGGIQALSRSYFAKIVPPERSGEYFGLMDICGKGASFMGTTVVGLASQAFGSINIGISAIVFLFLAGALFFMKTEHSGSESMKNQENVVMGQQMFHD